MSAKSSTPKNSSAWRGGPKKARRPPGARKATWSHNRMFWVAWVIRMTVRPPRARRARSCMVFFSIPGSNPEVGSSMNSTPGSVRSSTPTLTRLRSPPLRVPIRFWRRCPRPIVARTKSTRRWISRWSVSAGRRMRAEKWRASSTSRSRCTMSSWGTYPSRERKRSVASEESRPLYRTRPAVGRRRPRRQLSRVDLPAPLAPTRATNSPGRTDRLTRSRMARSEPGGVQTTSTASTPIRRPSSVSRRRRPSKTSRQGPT